MILGFKDQFVPYVLEGSKTHTIRAGDRWRAGMRADLFSRPRQKDMRLLFRAPVVRVETIEIRETTIEGDRALEVLIDGVLLDRAETEALFWRDGFRKPEDVPAVDLAHAFWMDRLPFHGQIIHWDYARRYVPCGECGTYCCPRLHGRQDTSGMFPKANTRWAERSEL